jgi:uncharacterized protein DUF4365
MGPSNKNKTAHRKRRPSQHIMEDQSRQVVREVLPSHWAVHDFDKPDYGIDVVVEIFEKVDETFEALGEFLYVQVKSVKNARVEKVKIYPVNNVARQPWLEDKSRWIEYDVVKFPIETDLLYTVQTMGTSVSVMLFVVDLATRNTYFLCLNDYIDKYLMPSNPGFWDQEAATLYIPVVNILGHKDGETALAFYGKRGKLLSAFSKFQYQRYELEYLFAQLCWQVASNAEFDAGDEAAFAGGIKVVLYFIEQIENLDIWDFSAWVAMIHMKNQIAELQKLLSRDPRELSKDIFHTKMAIDGLWRLLANTNNLFEEIIRERHLPKYIYLFMRADTPPEQYA